MNPQSKPVMMNKNYFQELEDLEEAAMGCFAAPSKYIESKKLNLDPKILELIEANANDAEVDDNEVGNIANLTE
jgi:hypothetical protein